MDFISDYNTYEVPESTYPNSSETNVLDGPSVNRKTNLNIDFLNNYKNITMSKILGTTSANFGGNSNENIGSNKKIHDDNFNARIDSLINKNLDKLQIAKDVSKSKHENLDIIRKSFLNETLKLDQVEKPIDVETDINSFANIINTSESLFQLQKGMNTIDDLLKVSENGKEKDAHFIFNDISILIGKSNYGKISRDFLQLENNRLQLEKLDSFLHRYSEINNVLVKSTKNMTLFSELHNKINAYKTNLLNETDLKAFNTQIREIQHEKLQLKVLKNLQKLFSLSPLEQHILYNENIVNDETINIIDKLQKIKQRCIYMGNCSNLQHKVENGLQYGLRKLYNYLISSLNENFLNEMIINRKNHKTIEEFQKQIYYLSENDLELYHSFINKFVDIEHKKITASFLNQFDLTSKSNSNPIYLNIDEPTRYLGDVLAYVHSLILNEYDFIENLFVKGKNTSMGKVFDDLDVKLLDDIFNKFNSLVKIRLEQVVKFEEDSSILIQCVQVLSFYKTMFLRSKLSEDNLIIQLLYNLLRYCDNVIIYTTESYLNDTLNYKNVKDLSNLDLQPPDWLLQYLHKLSVILSNFDDFKTIDIFDITFFKKFDKTLIEKPLIFQLNEQLSLTYPSKLTNKDLNIKIASLILKCNCLDLINSRLLLPFNHTFFQDEKNERIAFNKLENDLKECIDALKELTLRILLKNLEIYDYYNLLNMIFPINEVKSELDYEMYYSISDNSIFTLDAIEKGVKINFEEQLPLLMTNLESQLVLNLLSSPLITNEILNDSFKKFFKFYKTFHNILKLVFPKDLVRLDTIFKYTDDEVYTILGLENYMDEDIYIEKENSI